MTKEQKSKATAQGLGDSIKKVTDMLRIPQCGACKRRQQKLNRLFPYNNGSKNKK